jgi:hypothetical protein
MAANGCVRSVWVVFGVDVPGIDLPAKVQPKEMSGLYKGQVVGGMQGCLPALLPIADMNVELILEFLGIELRGLPIPLPLPCRCTQCPADHADSGHPSLLRTWTSICSRCPRAMDSLLSASLTTALRSPRSLLGDKPTMAGTLRAGGRENISPGIGMAPGSPAPASPPGGPPAGTKASPRWKGEGTQSGRRGPH